MIELSNDTSDSECVEDGRPTFHGMLSRPISQGEIVVLLYGGLVAPVFAHLFLVPALTGDIRYQSGLLSDQYGFVLTFGAMAWMYPLLFFSLTAFATAVLDLENAGKSFWIRLGLSTSLPIGVVYHIALLVRFNFGLDWLIWYHVIPVIVWGVGWAYVKLMIFATPNRAAAWVYGSATLIGGTTLVTAVCVIVTGDRSYFSFLVVPFAAVLCGSFVYSPILLLASHGWMIARVLTSHAGARRVSLGWLMCWVTWLACFFAACRYSVATSLKEYSRLPLEDPGTCYVATAACRGHSRLVRAKVTRSGRRWNRQLQVLKAFEITLATLVPTFHRRLRRAYDWLGPLVAHQAQSAWVSDLLYLSLKPLEWCASLSLRLFLGRSYGMVARLYRDARPGSQAA